MNKSQIVDLALSIAFKLPSLKGKFNSGKSLVCYEWFATIRIGEVARQIRDHQPQTLFILFFVTGSNGEKVVIKKLLGEDDQEKRLFIREAKILHWIKSEHIDCQV